MKSIDLKSVLAFIFVGVMAMLICGLFYNDYLEQQPCAVVLRMALRDISTVHRLIFSFFKRTKEYSYE